MSQIINDNRWRVSDSDFAQRITISDLKSFFAGLSGTAKQPKVQSLIIEPGTRSLIFDNGVLIGELYAGEYTMESFLERLRFWRNHQSTVFLTRSEDIPFQSNLVGLPCLEGVCFDVDVRWTLQTSDVLLFMENLMGASNAISVSRLEQLLAPVLHQAIRDTLGQFEYDFIVRGNFLREFSDGIRSRVEVKFSRYGLVFNDIQKVDLKPQDGGIANRKSEQWLTTREIQLERAAKQFDNDRLRIKAEAMRQEVDLRKSLRGLVSEDNLNKIKNKEDFERSIDEVDRHRLLRTEEREQLVAAYEERKDDRLSLREHLLSLLNLHREQEIEELRLAVDHTVRMKSLEQEIEQARIARGAEAERWRSELDRQREFAESRRQQQSEEVKARWERIREARKQKRDDAWESLLHTQRAEAIRADLEIGRANRQRQLAIVQIELENRLAQEKLEIQKRQDVWEIESREKRSSSQLDRLQRVQEMNALFAEKQQRLQLEMENLRAESSSKRELDRIQAMSRVSTEVLIATADHGNASLLAELKKHEASQDTLKAQAAVSPASEINAERLRLYEQLNAAERAKADAIAEAYKMAMQAQHSSVNQMIGGLAQAAAPPHQSFSTHQYPPSHIAPPPTPVATVWYASINGQQSPALQWTDLQQHIRVGNVIATTLVWKAGMPAWAPAGQVPELANLLAVTSGSTPTAFGPPPL